MNGDSDNMVEEPRVHTYVGIRAGVVIPIQLLVDGKVWKTIDAGVGDIIEFGENQIVVQIQKDPIKIEL